jgi:acetyl-CoA carboxylase carboxyltransferase component
VCLLGLESHQVPRKGFVPADGPPAWTSGTLFPQASRKTARAVNAASGNRPLVVLANLSGFDGSPESMRRRQLEYGAEIGRAVTNFKGPIVFVVVSRYHGGAFVVFSKALNESMEIAAVEGSFCSVIGGAPAAATVFRTRGQAAHRPATSGWSPRGQALGYGDRCRGGPAAGTTGGSDRGGALGASSGRWRTSSTRSTPIERAQRVGSVDEIIAASDVRPWIIEALERGMAREEAVWNAQG